MRLNEEEIERICHKILASWKEKNLATMKDEGQAFSFLQATFAKNLQDEDNLNKEVEQLLKKYDAQINAGMDRRKLFQMIKNQLIKERKLVI
ncbi:MAG: DUF507 family protein [Bdellovibrionota bacterium]